MVSDHIVRRVRHQLKKGTPVETITYELLSAGHTEKEIDKVFEKARSGDVLRTSINEPITTKHPSHSPVGMKAHPKKKAFSVLPPKITSRATGKEERHHTKKRKTNWFIKENMKTVLIILALLFLGAVVLSTLVIGYFLSTGIDYVILF